MCQVKYQIQKLSLVANINKFSMTQLYIIFIMIQHIYDWVPYIFPDFILCNSLKNSVTFVSSSLPYESNFVPYPLGPDGIWVYF